MDQLGISLYLRLVHGTYTYDDEKFYLPNGKSYIISYSISSNNFFAYSEVRDQFYYGYTLKELMGKLIYTYY